MVKITSTNPPAKKRIKKGVKFNRIQHHRFMRLDDRWRKPKGIDCRSRRYVSPPSRTLDIPMPHRTAPHRRHRRHRTTVRVHTHASVVAAATNRCRAAALRDARCVPIRRGVSDARVHTGIDACRRSRCYR